MTEGKQWYVLRAKFKQEITVRDALRHKGFHCYVPMIYRVETVRGHKVRCLVPAITELVFVHATSVAINDFKLRSKETIYWLTRPRGNRREKIIVPDKAMQDFIRITEQAEQSVTYFHPDELNLSKGDHITIHGGPFDGVEGILLKVKGKRDKQLIISIPDIAAAAVSIRPDLIEVVRKHPQPSRNLQQDSRELIRLSAQMLTATPDRIADAMEYDLLYSAIRHFYDSLYPLRGYLHDLEGTLALALLMGETVLNCRQYSTVQRFLKALDDLSDRSLLRVRMQLIGGSLLHNVELNAKARQTIAQWKAAGPTQRQQAIVEEAAIWDP